jgi:hypothetical protein
VARECEQELRTPDAGRDSGDHAASRTCAVVRQVPVSEAQTRHLSLTRLAAAADDQASAFGGESSGQTSSGQLVRKPE